MASEEEAYYGSPAPASPVSKAVKLGGTPHAKNKAKVKKLEEDLETSREETKAMRKKLHNAIRKGKGIEQEKNALAEDRDKYRAEALELEKRVEELKSKALEDSKASQGHGGGTDDAEATKAKEEVEQLKKQVKSLNQKAEVERKLKEADAKESQTKVEEKDKVIEQLKQEMAHLQSAVRSAAERAANATVNESKASEEHEQQLSQVKTLQRRVAELEGQLEAVGDQEQEKQRLVNEALNLRTERDELENEKLRLESDNQSKQDQLAQVEDQLKSVQKECVSLTQAMEQAKQEARQEIEETESEVAEEREQAKSDVKAALEREARASEREEKAVKSMEEMAQTLQSYRLDEEDRKKKFARLQAQYSSDLEKATSEIDRLNEQVVEQQKTIEEYSSRQAEATVSGEVAAENPVQEDQLKSALVAATEPLSKKIEEYRLKAEETEQQLKASRQKNMELTASLAQMEVSASGHLKVEESVGLYKTAIDEAQAREQALQQELDGLLHERDTLKRTNEELMAGNTVASSSEIKLLREQVDEAQMLKMQAEDSTRKVKQLQKENKDLRWQIAMTSTDESIKVDIPKHLDPARHLPKPKGPFAFLVKHRKQVAIIYLLILHFLVYFALTHHSTKSHHHQSGTKLHEQGRGVY
ncbi:hypothetical protein HOP50_15g76240 [Chloropicon primus]|uniref:Uncharacterized protein n=1 Tax=Chloropicon primus TaxID=1764295 RepID=A0A5B8MW83_9CHLO|nr:hypothetical protein A3770_15p75960 [Chloropicon primus]UPR04287.1 hypothetical protein HOP50_15g76240 [Chloropicon primus]|eukprot:QDZ25078.1 hypothetical protein A3770_15p75960 [Chloropicon primus]